MESLVYKINRLKHKVVLWEKAMKRERCLERDRIEVKIKDVFL